MPHKFKQAVLNVMLARRMFGAKAFSPRGRKPNSILTSIKFNHRTTPYKGNSGRKPGLTRTQSAHARNMVRIARTSNNVLMKRLRRQGMR